VRELYVTDGMQIRFAALCSVEVLQTWVREKYSVICYNVDEPIVDTFNDSLALILRLFFLFYFKILI